MDCVEHLDQYKKNHSPELANEIYKIYVKYDAEREINIENGVREEIVPDTLQFLDGSAFHLLEITLRLQLKHDKYNAFLNSDHFAEFIDGVKIHNEMMFSMVAFLESFGKDELDEVLLDKIDTMIGSKESEPQKTPRKSPMMFLKEKFRIKDLFGALGFVKLEE